MADFVPIQVDDAYLKAIQIVFGNLSTMVVNSPQGNLSGFALKAGGAGYTHGANVVSRFTTAATGVEQALTTFGTTLSDRASQIRVFQQTTDDTESLNDESADFFRQHFPGWLDSGGVTTPSTTPPTTTPPTTTPPTTTPHTTAPPPTTTHT